MFGNDSHFVLDENFIIMNYEAYIACLCFSSPGTKRAPGRRYRRHCRVRQREAPNHHLSRASGSQAPGAQPAASCCSTAADAHLFW